MYTTTVGYYQTLHCAIMIALSQASCLIDFTYIIFVSTYIISIKLFFKLYTSEMVIIAKLITEKTDYC